MPTTSARSTARSRSSYSNRSAGARRREEHEALDTAVDEGSGPFLTKFARKGPFITSGTRDQQVRRTYPPPPAGTTPSSRWTMLILPCHEAHALLRPEFVYSTSTTRFPNGPVYASHSV